MLVVVLLLGMFAPSVLADSRVAINYIALGDSLAAGVTPYKEIGDGYANLIAKRFEEEGILQSFTKQYSYPGFTSQQVLDGLENEALKEALKTANLVTISAGANDLLSLVTMNKETFELTYDSTQFQPALVNLSKNLTEIILQIKTLNPKIDLYVMGYFFPFPHLPADKKAELIVVSNLLNKTIEGTTVAAGAKFVPVSDKFGTDAKVFLPNPEDVHPSLDGYQLMADAFFERYLSPKEFPSAFEDVPQNHWAFYEITLLAKTGVLQGITDTVYKPDEALTRAQAAVALANIIPVTTSIPPNPGFADVSESHPDYDQIAKMTEVGVFSKANKFYPDEPLTRVQLAKIIALAFDLNGHSSFVAKDLPNNHWGKAYMDAVVSAGILKGFPDGTIRPNEPTSRAQFAAILVRTLAIKGLLL